MAKLLMLVAASLAFTVGGVCMKYSEGLTKLTPSVMLFSLFVLGAGFQAVAMRGSEMSVVYLFVLGLEAILAFISGVVLFGDAVNSHRILAVFFITAGIVLLHW